jgi:hypothetical protein
VLKALIVMIGLPTAGFVCQGACERAVWEALTDGSGRGVSIDEDEGPYYWAANSLSVRYAKLL